MFTSLDLCKNLIDYILVRIISIKIRCYLYRYFTKMSSNNDDPGRTSALDEAYRAGRAACQRMMIEQQTITATPPKALEWVAMKNVQHTEHHLQSNSEALKCICIHDMELQKLDLDLLDWCRNRTKPILLSIRDSEGNVSHLQIGSRKSTDFNN